MNGRGISSFLGHYYKKRECDRFWKVKVIGKFGELDNTWQLTQDVRAGSGSGDTTILPAFRLEHQIMQDDHYFWDE
jgi:hypothetical protein